jgi:hypothetical protein
MVLADGKERSGAAVVAAHRQRARRSRDVYTPAAANGPLKPLLF